MPQWYVLLCCKGLWSFVILIFLPNNDEGGFAGRVPLNVGDLNIGKADDMFHFSMDIYGAVRYFFNGTVYTGRLSTKEK